MVKYSKGGDSMEQNAIKLKLPKALEEQIFDALFEQNKGKFLPVDERTMKIEYIWVVMKESVNVKVETEDGSD